MGAPGERAEEQKGICSIQQSSGGWNIMDVIYEGMVVIFQRVLLKPWHWNLRKALGVTTSRRMA